MPHGQEFDPRQYMLDKTFEAFSYVDHGVTRVNSHFHNYYEVYFFVSGDVTYVAADKEYKLIPGDILLIPPKTPHHPIFHNTSMTYSRLVLWFSESFIESAQESCNCNFAYAFDIIYERGSNLLRLKPNEREELFEIVTSMATREKGMYTRAENNISLLSLMIRLNKLYAAYPNTVDDQDSFARHLVRAVDYIVNNYNRSISLEDVASQCYVSKYHLSREFKKRMGLTVQQYIRLRRLYRARQLLESGAKPGVAAKTSGFADYSAFYRAYVSEYGRSPCSTQAADRRPPIVRPLPVI